METIMDKVKKHGITGSLKIAINLASVLPDKLKIILAQHRSYNDMVIKKIQGSLMILDLNDVGISHELMLTGVHEAVSTKQYCEEIKRGMTLLEVGANIGYYALLGSRLIGENGRIYAFEPSPVNMSTLKANISLNSMDDIIATYPYGIGNESGMQRFSIMSKGNMSSFITRREDSIIKERDYVDVEVVRIDDFFAGKDVTIDYARMDVEGFEFEVIKGMENLLNSPNGPKGLFIEIHSELLNNIGTSCREFITFLLDRKYDIKKARYRGNPEISVSSTEKMLNHRLIENGYWEAFFTKIQ